MLTVLTGPEAETEGPHSQLQRCRVEATGQVTEKDEKPKYDDYAYRYLTYSVLVWENQAITGPDHRSYFSPKGVVTCRILEGISENGHNDRLFLLHIVRAP